ncbi:MAG: MoaD/ThiS family protein [Pseudonocardiaceae bacterium]
MELQVRYYASARAAAGTEGETITVPEGASVADVLSELRSRHSDQLSRVFSAASFLLNGVAVRLQSQAVSDGAQLDVLPPFAGG